MLKGAFRQAAPRYLHNMVPAMYYIRLNIFQLVFVQFRIADQSENSIPIPKALYDVCIFRCFCEEFVSL